MKNLSKYGSSLRGLGALPLVVALIGVLAQLCILSGCNTSGCTDNRSALPLMGFYSSTTGTSIILDSLEIGGVGAPDDSLLMKAGSSAYQLYLPFRFNQQETSFRFHYAYSEQGLDIPELDDIITFTYTTEPYFASEECGAYYIYHITGLNYTTHLIDSVVIVDSVVTNVEMERFKVYFRTGEMESPDEPENPQEGDSSDNPDDGDDASQEGEEPDAEVSDILHTAIRPERRGRL